MPPRPRLTPEERHARKLASTQRWRARNQERIKARDREAYHARIAAMTPEELAAFRAKNTAAQIRRDARRREAIHARITSPPSRASRARHARERRARHPEASRAADNAYNAVHREARNAQARAFTKRHPEKRRVHDHRRRARLKRVAINDATTAQEKTLIDAAHGVCAYCSFYNPGCQACQKGTHTLTIDHITAIAHGGNNTLHNLITCCKSCNSKKKTRLNPVPIQPLLL